MSAEDFKSPFASKEERTLRAWYKAGANLAATYAFLAVGACGMFYGVLTAFFDWSTGSVVGGLTALNLLLIACAGGFVSGTADHAVRKGGVQVDQF